MTILLVVAVIILARAYYILSERVNQTEKASIQKQAAINILNKFILSAESLKHDIKQFEQKNLSAFNRTSLPRYQEELNKIAFYEKYANELGLGGDFIPDTPPSRIKELPGLLQETKTALSDLQKSYPQYINEVHIKWTQYEELESALGEKSNYPEYNDLRRCIHLQNYLNWLTSEIESYQNIHKNILKDSAFLKLKEMHSRICDL